MRENDAPPTLQDPLPLEGGGWIGNRKEHLGSCVTEGDVLVLQLREGFIGLHFTIRLVASTHVNVNAKYYITEKFKTFKNS